MEPPTSGPVDIEDFAPPGAGANRARKAHVLPKRASRKHANHTPIGDSYIPGTETIYVKTWGCGHNNSDGEYMAGLLVSYGYKLTDTPENAQLWVLNSCAVKNPSEEGFNNMVKKAQAAGKEVVVAGCVPQGQPEGKFAKGLSIVGVQQIDRVVEVVEETLKGNTVRLIGQRKMSNNKKAGGARLDLPKVRRNPLVEVIPISTGCLNQCTYCKTKHARGELGSYPPSQIVQRVKDVIGEGVIEIWLTSEDTGAYGRDIGTDITVLLQEILDAMPDGTMLRLGMTNPPYILEHVEAMCRLLAHPRMYAYLHLPVQACADEILYRMKREYTLADFRKVVDGVLAAHPDMTVATDIIAGFPGETEEDFQVTMDVCQEYKFPCLYINQFFARPGTPAARMEKVDTKEVKGRTKRLSTLFQSYHPHAGKEGREYQVLCAELSNDKKFYVAHNKSYEQILVPKSADLLGKQFRVKIISTGKFHMMGEVVEGSLANAPALVTPLPYGSVSGGSVADPRRVEKLKAAEPVGASKDAATAVALKEDAGWSTTQYLFAGAFVLLLGDLVRVAWRYYEANSAANQTA